MRRVVTLALCALTLTPASAVGAIRYVLQSGIDTPNDSCLQATPCRTVNKAIQVAGPGDTIRLGKGKFFESGLFVGKNLTIEGQGIFKTWIVGSPNWGGGRVFTIAPDADVLIRRLQIQKGVGDFGGGIRNFGTLELEDVWLRQNIADAGGGIFSSGSLTLRRVEVALNRGQGGVYNNNGVAVILDSRIAANRGGGIVNSFSELTLVNSVVVANVAFEDARTTSLGHGLLVLDGTATAINSTISGNQGSGLQAVSNGSALLSHVTIARNSAGISVDASGNVSLINTIVALNELADCQQQLGQISGTHSLVGVGCLDFPTPDNVIGVPAKLAGLAPNDHPIAWTHALLPGSPAIDSASAEHCLAVDQRGVARPKDGDGDGVAHCDMGAFELIAPGNERGGRGGR